MSKILCCLFLMFSISCQHAGEKITDIINVRIVPTNASKEGGRIINLSQPFYVVVTNVSNKPIRLWREWCSWGYDTLSFQVTDENGKTTIIKKKPGEWGKNFPDWIMVAPGDHMVFSVLFDGTNWPKEPLTKKDGVGRKVKIKAIFEILKDEDTKEHKVWTGKVTSPENNYTLY